MADFDFTVSLCYVKIVLAITSKNASNKQKYYVLLGTVYYVTRAKAPNSSMLYCTYHSMYSLGYPCYYCWQMLNNTYADNKCIVVIVGNEQMHVYGFI